jgi:hypothetical protein
VRSWRFAQVLYIADLNGYNLLCREEEREMLPLCVDPAIGVA